MDDELVVVGTLSDDELDERLLRLAQGERKVLVVFLAHLGELDRRRAHEPRSFTSLFEYRRRRLGLSEAEAYLRIRAARLMRAHPAVAEMLADGTVNVTALARVSAHMTPENAPALLARIQGKSRREVERVALEFESGGPRADVIRAIPASRAECGDAEAVSCRKVRGTCSSPLAKAQPGETDLFHGGGDEGPSTLPSADTVGSGEDAPLAPAETTGESAGVVPDSTGKRLFRISFTASEQLHGDLERARALLRHKYPAGRLEDVIGEALGRLLDIRDPDRRSIRKRASTGPRSVTRRAARGALSRRVPRRVRDEVWRRDGGCCAFVAADGRRCGARQWLEFDHVIPWALGGRSDDPSNVRLLCRVHNQMAARRIFGG